MGKATVYQRQNRKKLEEIQTDKQIDRVARIIKHVYVRKNHV